ncbi:MAG: energy transducer TonB [Bacteroidota bacterium]
MESQSNFHGLSMDEIIFNDRNKAYGAFTLRTNYQKNLKLALMVCTSVFVLGMVSPRLFMTQGAPLLGDQEQNDTFIAKPIVDPIPMEEKKLKVEEGGGAPEEKLSDYRPTDRASADTAATKPTLNNNVVAGDTRTPGNDSGLLAGNQGNGIVKPDDRPKTGIYSKPKEVMPQFEGGAEAIEVFIDGNKKAEITENGEEGLVLVSFTVDEKGYIGNVALKHSSGNKQLDNEAMRLVKIQPRYKPGTIDGIPTKMLCEMSILFTGFDD